MSHSCNRFTSLFTVIFCLRILRDTSGRLYRGKGRGEGCVFFSSVHLHEVSKTVHGNSYIHFHSANTLPFQSLYLVLLMAKGEQRLLYQNEQSFLYATTVRAIKYLDPPALALYCRPQFLLYWSIFIPNTLTQFASFYLCPVLLTVLLFQIHTDAIFK